MTSSTKPEKSDTSRTYITLYERYHFLAHPVHKASHDHQRRPEPATDPGNENLVKLGRLLLNCSTYDAIT